jgi:hypothetical protein
MPLLIDPRAEPVRDDIAQAFLIEALDGETPVTIAVPFAVLREKGAKQGLHKNMHTEDIFRVYRAHIINLASEANEAGRWVASERRRTIRIETLD